MAEYRYSGKELRKSSKGVFAGVLLIALLCGGLYAAWKVKGGMVSLEPQEESAEDSDSEEEIDIPILNEESSEAEPTVAYSYEAVFRDQLSVGALTLVNAENGIDDLTDGLASVGEQRNEHFIVKDMTVKMQEECIAAVGELFDGFYDATGLKDVQIISGYRTKAEQGKIYQQAGGANSKAAEAGHSDYETGYAFGVNRYTDGVTGEFDGTGDYAWLAQHCAEYGFVLRYPEGKAEVTGCAYDPTHFRYVGKPHAMYMAANGMCLEEYAEFLKGYSYEGEHLVLTDAQGVKYEVFYVEADADGTGLAEVPVPVDHAYTVSGNNSNGFIVTVTME